MVHLANSTAASHLQWKSAIRDHGISFSFANSLSARVLLIPFRLTPSSAVLLECRNLSLVRFLRVLTRLSGFTTALSDSDFIKQRRKSISFFLPARDRRRIKTAGTAISLWFSTVFRNHLIKPSGMPRRMAGRNSEPIRATGTRDIRISNVCKTR